MVETTHNANMKKEQYKDMKLYKSSDMGLAAAMMVIGKKLLYIEPIRKGGLVKNDIFQFIFEDEEDTEKIVLEYSTNNANLTVIPNAYRSTMRYLKEMTKNYEK